VGEIDVLALRDVVVQSDANGRVLRLLVHRGLHYRHACLHIPRGDRIAPPRNRMSRQPFNRPPHERGIFCNRTLNMRSIRAIGYDMDYTLIHYHSAVWERAAYEYTKRHFVEKGWPVAELEFDAEIVSRGLIIDTELGNLLK